MGVLLLNASYEPLHIIGVSRAVSLILCGKAELVTGDDDEPLRSPSISLPRPRIVRLVNMVKVPFRKAPLTRAALRARDNDTCQVAGCNKKGDTIDHVIPRSRYQGNPHVWENVVLMCGAHNHKKGNRTLKEVGWHLKKRPTAPRGPIIFLDAQLTAEWEAVFA